MDNFEKETAIFEKSNNSFSRIDAYHILDIYLGTDLGQRETLLILSDDEPDNIYSSSIIKVDKGKRKDGRWALSFSLMDKMYRDMFLRFCNDIIESSRSIKKKEDGISFVCSRYQKWQNMLKKTIFGILSKSQIKGLIGELIFLKDYLLKKYGENESISSWIGPIGSDQDFVFENRWYEIKTVSSGASYITISSVEQLDTINEGEIVIIYLDETSESDENKITLNSLYKTIKSSLNPENILKFEGILLNNGYFIKKEYEEILFSLKKIERYEVKEGFPRIRRKYIDSNIEKVEYTLSIAGINDFKRRD